MEYTSGAPRKNPSRETSPAFEGRYLTIIYKNDSNLKNHCRFLRFIH